MFKQSIANGLSFLNLSFGVLSILESYKHNFGCAAIFIIIAALIDRYDGRIARILNISSQLGKELDSLADLVSFGVAPSILIFSEYYLINLGSMKLISITFILVYISSGAYRLAKYNISEFNGIFTGVPITIAGAAIAFYSLIMPSNSISMILSIALVAILAYLMVSKLRFKKL